MADTVRSHLEAIRDRHHAHDYLDVYDKPLPDVGCAACPYPQTWPCPDREDAVAALALLDEAPIDIFRSTFVRVPESDWIDAVRLAPETRHISLPDPRVEAEADA